MQYKSKKDTFLKMKKAFTEEKLKIYSRKSEFEKLRLRIREKRRKNFEKINRMEKILKVKDSWDHVKRREEKFLYEYLQDHRDFAIKLKQYRKIKNKKKEEKAERLKKEVEEIRNFNFENSLR